MLLNKRRKKSLVAQYVAHVQTEQAGIDLTLWTHIWEALSSNIGTSSLLLPFETTFLVSAAMWSSHWQNYKTNHTKSTAQLRCSLYCDLVLCRHQKYQRIKACHSSVALVCEWTILSDLCLWAALVPIFVDRGFHMDSATDPYTHILSFLDWSRYYFLQVAPQLYSWGWVDPVTDPLLLRKYGSAGNRTRTAGSVARNSDH
jgi:hypothetical protein